MCSFYVILCLFQTESLFRKVKTDKQASGTR